MKKLMAAVLAGLMLAGLLSGCTSTANDDEVEYRWKMALNSTEGDNAYDTGVLFAQKIKELTDGRVQVDLYGGAQLGTTAEVLEGMYAGVADVMCESIGTLATFTPLANIEAIPPRALLSHSRRDFFTDRRTPYAARRTLFGNGLPGPVL